MYSFMLFLTSILKQKLLSMQLLGQKSKKNLKAERKVTEMLSKTNCGACLDLD